MPTLTEEIQKYRVILVEAKTVLLDSNERVQFTTHSGDEYYAPNKAALDSYRAAVKNKDWNKVQHYEETWTSLDSIKAKNAAKKQVKEEFGRKDEDPDYTVDQETDDHEKKGPECEGEATDADSPLTKKIRESGPWGKKITESTRLDDMGSQEQDFKPAEKRWGISFGFKGKDNIIRDQYLSKKSTRNNFVFTDDPNEAVKFSKSFARELASNWEKQIVGKKIKGLKGFF